MLKWHWIISLVAFTALIKKSLKGKVNKSSIFFCQIDNTYGTSVLDASSSSGRRVGSVMEQLIPVVKWRSRTLQNMLQTIADVSRLNHISIKKIQRALVDRTENHRIVEPRGIFRDKSSLTF